MSTIDKIYIDMDGVLTNFGKQFLKISNGVPSYEYEQKHGSAAFWKLISDAGEDWWTTMEWLPGAKKLIAYIKSTGIPFEILSAPAKTIPHSRTGKVKWCNKNLPGVKLILENDKHKYATPTSVLVDDWLPKITKWEQAGGIPVRYYTDNPSRGLQALKALVDKQTTEINENLLTEKQLTFNADKRYGQVVILAGGAGSGKGYALKNYIDKALFKVFDVDDFKTKFIKLNQAGKLTVQNILDKYGSRNPKLADEVKKQTVDVGRDLKDLDLKKPDDVRLLHAIVKLTGLTDKYIEKAIHAESVNEGPAELPNVVFDVTLKDMSGFREIVDKITRAGYKPEDTHLVWVLTNVDIALQQNKERSRTVPEDILLATHTGARQTVYDLLTRIKPKQINGKIAVVLNNPGLTVDTPKPSAFSSEKERRKILKNVINFVSLIVKDEKKPIKPKKDWLTKLKGWIEANAPKLFKQNEK